jgi:hypothetical protein|tara:strand:- start:3261 stop:3398 length:138 start_codon:yes stop_codon:yes gene_type:complete
MSLLNRVEIKIIVGLFLFVILFYKIVTMNKNEDIRRKELRMKYYL